MADYLVQEEDGVSRFELEDGTGFILLEEQGGGGVVLSSMVELGHVNDSGVDNGVVLGGVG